jgi:hypothetical protein
MNTAKLLMGIGCAGQCESLMGIGSATSDLTNYDIITVGGKQYSANQIVDKTLFAEGNVPVYLASDFTRPFMTIKAGQAIGKVYSYIRTTQETAKNAGSPLLMFYTDPTFQSSSNRAYFAKDEAAISQTALKDQGAVNTTDETKIMQEEQARQDNPVLYYLKKVGLPVLLIGGGVYAVVQLGKAFITKPRPAPAVAGIKKRK